MAVGVLWLKWMCCCRTNRCGIGNGCGSDSGWGSKTLCGSGCGNVCSSGNGYAPIPVADVIAIATPISTAPLFATAISIFIGTVVPTATPCALAVDISLQDTTPWALITVMRRLWVELGGRRSKYSFGAPHPSKRVQACVCARGGA